MTAVAGSSSGTRGAGTADVDFDLHGFVGIRLRDALPGDVAMVTRQIGPLVAPLRRAPDISVRFVDRLPDRGRMTFAGWPDCAATADEFYLLRGRDGVGARTLLPVQDVGGTCEIVCERRAGHVPHLLAVINFTALANGVLPLHASAFTYRGAGVLATGWAKGGKTETLLAFAERGASYVGDEWVYLTADGMMHGVPEPIRLWHWHVRQLPRLRSGLSPAVRTRLAGLPAAASAAAALAARLPANRAPASVLRRAAPVLRRQAYVHVPPAELFGASSVDLRGRLDTVLLVASHDGPEVVIEPVEPDVVARRMRASLDEERAPFLAVYRQFRFLFPDRRSEVVDLATDIERTLLHRLLAGRPAHLLRHPYPMRIDSLVGPVESVL